MRYLAGEVERLLREERKMAFVAGPRQVGKTTLARALLGEVGQGGNYFNWDVESQRPASRSLWKFSSETSLVRT